MPTGLRSIASRIANIGRDRTFRLFFLLGYGLLLGACSKCDVPTPWEHSSAGSAPLACHGTPPPQ
jgi:hypothetical protein